MPMLVSGFFVLESPLPFVGRGRLGALGFFPDLSVVHSSLFVLATLCDFPIAGWSEQIRKGGRFGDDRSMKPL